MSLTSSEYNSSFNIMNISNSCNKTLNQSNEFSVFNCIYELSITNTTDDLYNYNYAPYPDFTQLSFVRIIFLLLYVIVMFLALFGNFVVCYTVVSNRKMQTVVNCYIVNLAVCDFLVGAFVLPVKLLELMAPANWYALSDGLCTAMLYLQTVIVFASVLTLVATCLERYFAIVHPLKSRMHQSKSRTLRIIVAVWVIPCLASTPFLYPEAEASENTLHSNYGSISRLTCFINFDPDFRRGYYTFLFVFFYLIPLVFIAWTCFCIAQSLLRNTVLYRQGSLRRQEVNRRKIGKMILIVVMAYTISWTPYFLVSIITQYQEVNFMQNHDFFFTMLCINLFAFLNSAINPFIYATMSTRFRNGFMRVLKFIFCFPDANQNIESEPIPRRIGRMPKPLACLNKYHRQMMMFACGEASQLSTDSSTHNSESANAMFGSIHFNKTQWSFRRKRTLSTTSSINYANNNNHNQDCNNGNNSLRCLANNKLKSKLNTNTCGDRLLTLNLNGVPKTNPIESKSVKRQRTGSESILPSLRKFWEENFIDLGDNNDQIDCKSNTFCGVSATSLPNSPQDFKRSLIPNKDFDYQILQNSSSIQVNDNLIDRIKDTRV